MGAGNDVLVVLGIEIPYVGQGNAQHFADLAEMQVLVDMEGIYIGGEGHGSRLQAIFIGIAESVHGTHHSRNISAGFARKIGVNAPEIPAATGALDGLVHIAGTAVVGGNGQGPVPENAVGILEIAGCGIDGGDGIHSLIGVRIYAKAITDGRAVHKLPHSLGSHAGFRPGIESTFDDGYILELQRKVVAAEGLLDDGEIILGKAHHLRHFSRHLLRIQDHKILDRFVEGEGDEGIHFLQAAHQHRIRHIRSEHHGVHIVLLPARDAGLAVHIPLAQKGIRIGRSVVVFQPGRHFVLILSGEFFLNELPVYGIGLVGGHLFFQLGYFLKKFFVLFLKGFPAFEDLGGSRQRNYKDTTDYYY